MWHAYILVFGFLIGVLIKLCHDSIERYAFGKGEQDKRLNYEHELRRKQLETEYENRMAVLDLREAEIASREKLQAAWMESFTNDGSKVSQSTQIVVDFFASAQTDMNVYIHEIEGLEKNFFVSQTAFCRSVNQALLLMQTQQAQILSYAQTLAGYLHHFQGRVCSLLEQERQSKLREEQLLESSPYIVEKAFDNLFEKASNAFYHSQAMALNTYYQRVKDKRFKRAMIDGIHYTTGPTVICRIKSNDKNHPNPYVTSLSTCTCQDFRRHKQPCKHMLFLAYHTGYLFLNKEKLESSMKQHVEELKKN